MSPPEGAHGVGENSSPVAALMSSSASGHDCCGGLANIDFRKVQLAQQLRSTERDGPGRSRQATPSTLGGRDYHVPKQRWAGPEGEGRAIGGSGGKCGNVRESCHLCCSTGEPLSVIMLLWEIKHGSVWESVSLGFCM